MSALHLSSKVQSSQTLFAVAIFVNQYLFRYVFNISRLDEFRSKSADHAHTIYSNWSRTKSRHMTQKKRRVEKYVSHRLSLC